MEAKETSISELFEDSVQLIVPRWQRRFCWNNIQIKKLIDDMIATVTNNCNSHSTHFGGTVIVHEEPNEYAKVRKIRVIDGQQRLTTVSILLACIAKTLNSDRVDKLRNSSEVNNGLISKLGALKSGFKELLLQDGDDKEYKNCINDDLSGSGAITFAWKYIANQVEIHGTERLLAGVDRLRLLRIELSNDDRPQQIFERLNATGKPLTESEKVKNWLLLDMSEAEQNQLYENSWLEIERLLEASKSTTNIEEFLRDVVSTYTGRRCGKNQVYIEIQDWAAKTERDHDRSSICEEWKGLALLYGMIICTSKPQFNRMVERELRHLHEMRFKVHRPLALTLLKSASDEFGATIGDSELVEILTVIGTWITRVWLADEEADRLGEPLAQLAYLPGPGQHEDPVKYWCHCIALAQDGHHESLSNKAVRKGIRSKKAYTRNNPRPVKSILNQLESEARGELLDDHCDIEVEHVMPQELPSQWERDLGKGAQSIHRKYLDCLPNLTLVSKSDNARLSNKPFAKKRAIYRKSAFSMTRRISEDRKWGKVELRKREKELANGVLMRWPWPVYESESDDDWVEKPENTWYGLLWRIGSGEAKSEISGYKMVLNVAAALIAKDSRNAEALSGAVVCKDIQLANQPLPSSLNITHELYEVPGYPKFVLCPYGSSLISSILRCEEMGKRCGIRFDSYVKKYRRHLAFRELLKEKNCSLPGQHKWGNEETQCTDEYNSAGDCVRITIGYKSQSKIGLYIWTQKRESSDARANQTARYSKRTHELMSGQHLDSASESHTKGRSVRVLKQLTDDEHDWTDIARWVKNQHDVLRGIIESET